MRMMLLGLTAVEGETALISAAAGALALLTPYNSDRVLSSVHVAAHDSLQGAAAMHCNDVLSAWTRKAQASKHAVMTIQAPLSHILVSRLCGAISAPKAAATSRSRDLELSH